MFIRISPLPLALDVLATRATTLPTASVIAVRVAYVMLKWSERARARRALARLDDAGLKDIGVSRYDAERECAKPFWGM